METLKKELTTLLNSLPGTISLYVAFLSTNEEYMYHETTQIKAASVIKIPIACTLYNNSQINIHSWHTIQKENVVDGTGVLKLFNPETKYTLYDLALLMIALSDNTATNELVDILGWEHVEEYMNKLGLLHTTFKHKMMITAGRGENLTTAKDIGNLLGKLYTNKIPGAFEIIDMMKKQSFNQYLPKELSKDIEVAHKTGALPDALHDVGIVFSKEPFIFVFLSEGQSDKNKTAEVLSQCAKKCFDYVNGLK